MTAKTDQQPVRMVTGKPHHVKPAPAEQLSFLKFAVENGNGRLTRRKMRASRRDYCEATTHCLPE